MPTFKTLFANQFQEKRLAFEAAQRQYRSALTDYVLALRSQNNDRIKAADFAAKAAFNRSDILYRIYIGEDLPVPA